MSPKAWSNWLAFDTNVWGWRSLAGASSPRRKPTLDEGLNRAAESRLKRIVVQPHLLFRGLVLEEIRSTVARWQERQPEVEWIVTAHLGPEQEVVEAVVDRI